MFNAPMCQVAYRYIRRKREREREREQRSYQEKEREREQRSYQGLALKADIKVLARFRLPQQGYHLIAPSLCTQAWV